MDWFDYMHDYEKASGKFYDLGGFTGSIELYGEGHKLLAVLTIDQAYLLFKGLVKHHQDVFEHLDKDDIAKCEEMLERYRTNWKIEKNNLSDLEYFCYICQSMIEYDLTI